MLHSITYAVALQKYWIFDDLKYSVESDFYTGTLTLCLIRAGPKPDNNQGGLFSSDGLNKIIIIKIYENKIHLGAVVLRFYHQN